MFVERLLAHNHAYRFGFFFSTFGIGGGTLRWVRRGYLPRLLGECLSPYVRKGWSEGNLVGRRVSQALEVYHAENDAW